MKIPTNNLNRLIILSCIMLFMACKKELVTESTQTTTVTYETRNTYLYKTVLTGRLDSVTYNVSTGTSLYNLDSTAITNLYYYRLTSVINPFNNVEVPSYVTEFYFDSTSAMTYHYYSWYVFAGLYSGSTYAELNNEWNLTYYHQNSDTNNSFNQEYYFKEFNHITMPLPPLK